MPDPIVERTAISERARAAAKTYAETGVWPQNEYPALSEAARLFDIDLRRCIQGGEPGEEEGGA